MAGHTYFEEHGLYGVMAEFLEPEDLVKAAEHAHKAGYRKMDGYSPMPVEGLSEALGYRRHFVSMVVLGAGIIGCFGGFMLMWWMTVIAYAHNVAGRPMNSWVSYIPPTFECTVLAAGLTALFGMLAMNGLPLPYHPVFNVEEFTDRASRDRFFLVIESADPLFELDKTREFMSEMEPLGVYDVPK